jgi:hypothetical protein
MLRNSAKAEANISDGEIRAKSIVMTQFGTRSCLRLAASFGNQASIFTTSRFSSLQNGQSRGCNKKTAVKQSKQITKMSSACLLDLHFFQVINCEISRPLKIVSKSHTIILPMQHGNTDGISCVFTSLKMLDG